MQYHDVRLKLKLRPLKDVTNCAAGTKAPSVSVEDSFLLVDYIYLDAQERKKFAQATHEYLIEQLQFTGEESFKNSNESYRLNFNHPSKALVFAPRLAKYTSGQTFVDWAWDGDWEAARERVAKRVWLARNATKDSSSEDDVTASGDAVKDAAGNVLVDGQFVFHSDDLGDLNNVVLLTNNLTSEHMSMTVAQWVAMDSNLAGLTGFDVRDYMTYSLNADGTGNPVSAALLQLNGHDRFQKRDGAYFNYVQAHQHWNNTPADGINTYSFALNPMEHQPSGTCNFSRIDNTTLKLDLAATHTDDSRIAIYCVNYNVLRVMSGMGKNVVDCPEKHPANSIWVLLLENTVIPPKHSNTIRQVLNNVVKDASMLNSMQNHLLLETPKALTTKYLLKNKYGDDKTSMVKMLKMKDLISRNGQSADENLNSKWLEHGFVSETERWLVIYDSLTNLKWLKIQSTPIGNFRDFWVSPTPTKRNNLVINTHFNQLKLFNYN